MLILCIIITIIFLLMEIFSLYLWITKKYLPPKKITLSRLKKRIKEFYEYKSKFDKNEIILSDSMNKFLEDQKKIYENFVSVVILLGSVLIIYAITCSLFLGVFLFFKPKYVIIISLFIFVLEVSVFCELCRKLNKLVIERLDDFILFLFHFKRMLRNEKINEANKSIRIYNTVVTWVALILSIVIVFTFFQLLKKHDINWKNIFNIDINQNPAILVVLPCLIGTFLALLYFREMKSIIGKRGITFDIKLALWENDIENICSKLHIRNIEIKVVDDVKVTVYSILKKYEVPQIYIGGYYLNDLRDYYEREIFYNMVLFILGHELSHISSKDSLSRERFKYLLSLLIGLVIFLLLFKEINLSVYGVTGGKFFLAIINCVMIVLLLFTYVFFYKTWSDERYWKQVYELRADRIGFQVSNVLIDIFKELMFYSQNSETIDDFHPLYTTRIKEIEKYKNMKWGIKDQLRYTWKFAWNLRIHKEWRL